HRRARGHRAGGGVARLRRGRLRGRRDALHRWRDDALSRLCRGRLSMSSRIEDYALIGDFRTAGLVARNGSLDWLCWPRFDSGACFAALLGSAENGRWLIAPADPKPRVNRRYRENTLILETEFVTGEGSVTLVDFMPAPDPARLGRASAV